MDMGSLLGTELLGLTILEGPPMFSVKHPLISLTLTVAHLRIKGALGLHMLTNWRNGHVV